MASPEAPRYVESLAQYRKYEVDEAIAGAALEVFAACGYERTTIAEIARVAGVSVGNVYRYRPSKEVLLELVVHPEFVLQLELLLRQHAGALTRAYEGVEGSVDQAAFEEVLAFCTRHRLRAVFVLIRAEGSRYADFAPRLAQLLSKLALRHLRKQHPARKLSAALRFSVEQGCHALIVALAEALAQHQDQAVLREIATRQTRYLLAGLASLFADDPLSPTAEQ